MDILTALEARGIELKKVATTHGGEYAGPCPKCGGRDRFRCWPQEGGNGGRFFCRQCDKAGDLIEFYRWLDGMTYKDACEAAGVDAKTYQADYAKPKIKQPERSAFAPQAYDDPQELWREHAHKFVMACHAELMSSASALARLERTRGIRPETVERYKLGMNTDTAFYRPRASWGLPDVLKENGQPKKLWVPRGLVIPCYRVDTLLRVRVRRPKEDLRNADDPRYYFVPGSSAVIMRSGDRMRAYMVVESDLDMIRVHQDAGDLVGVVSMGTSSAKPDAECHRHLSGADVILVALDFDDAGGKGWSWWRDTYRQAERWPTPEGKDPGEMQGFDVRSWVIAGLPTGWGLSPDHFDLSGGGAQGAGHEDIAAPAVEAEDDLEQIVPAVDFPQSVARLGKLLKEYPVEVHITESRVAIHEKKGWNNWEVSKEISKLVFLDPDCFAYLHGFGVGEVNGKNFYDGGK